MRAVSVTNSYASPTFTRVNDFSNRCRRI
jgi:hypothetical protein